MSECKNPHIAEKLAMILSPEEFPDEAREIQEHLEECEQCRQELESLKTLDAFLRQHAKELAAPPSECPSPEQLMECADGQVDDPWIRNHLAACSACTEQVRLITELSGTSLEAPDASLTRREQRLISDILDRECGTAKESWGSRLVESIKALQSSFSLPALAAGAVVGALVVLLVLPTGMKQEMLMPAMSNVVWEGGSPSLMKKGGPAGQAIQERKKVALLIVVSAEQGLSQEMVDNIYRKITLPTKLSSWYEFLSPRDIEHAIGQAPRVRDARLLSNLVFSKVPADFLLSFELHKEGERYSLKGVLYERGGEAHPMSISHQGLPVDRVPSRVTTIGCELLMEAEHS